MDIFTEHMPSVHTSHCCEFNSKGSYCWPPTYHLHYADTQGHREEPSRLSEKRMSFFPSKMPVLVIQTLNFITHQEKKREKNHTKKCRANQKLPYFKARSEDNKNLIGRGSEEICMTHSGHCIEGGKLIYSQNFNYNSGLMQVYNLIMYWWSLKNLKQ